jgi:hypothetical protein
VDRGAHSPPRSFFLFLSGRPTKPRQELETADEQQARFDLGADFPVAIGFWEKDAQEGVLGPVHRREKSGGGARSRSHKEEIGRREELRPAPSLLCREPRNSSPTSRLVDRSPRERRGEVSGSLPSKTTKCHGGFSRGRSARVFLPRENTRILSGLGASKQALRNPCWNLAPWYIYHLQPNNS